MEISEFCNCISELSGQIQETFVNMQIRKILCIDPCSFSISAGTPLTFIKPLAVDFVGMSVNKC